MALGQKFRRAIFFTSVLCVLACDEKPANKEHLIIPDSQRTLGRIEILDDEALSLLEPSAKISIRGEGYRWIEGPLWVEEGGYLLFSDIPNNVVLQYKPQLGVSTYLEKSGATAVVSGDYTGGSNGLLLNKQGQLVLFQQGDRRVSIMDAPLSSPQANYTVLSKSFEGKRFNGPNDGVFHSNGSLYFTDPPYGLKGMMEDARKELPFQGVYKLDGDGRLTLLDDKVSYPNGIALSVDEKTLYLAVSDEEKPLWLAYKVEADGSLSNKRVFYDVSDLLGLEGEQGLPDGMVVHSSGNIFATGPGGVWLFTPEGKVLAKIRTGKLTANCDLSHDEKYLFITAHDTLLSIPLK